MTLSRLSSNRVAPYNIGTIGWDVLTVTPSGPNVVLSWPAMPSAVNYFVQVTGIAPVSVGNVTTYTYTGLTIGQAYTFSVVGVDASGNFSGSASQKTSTPPGWNNATGGTEATITNYNGTGQTWKTHTFSTSGTANLTVSVGSNPFTILACGGGGGGGGSNNAQHGGGGGGGRVGQGSITLPNGVNTVTVGAGGGGGGGNSNGAAGGNSTISSVSGLGGNGGTGNGGGATPGSGGANLTSTITGSSVLYGQDAPEFNSGNVASGPGGGGRGAPVGTNTGSAGQTGRVIIAYRIG